MSAFGEVLSQLRENQPQGSYGIKFEKLMVNYFRTDPVLQEQFSEVSRWSDWEFNGGKQDTGIDLVARRADDDAWVAIQCKFYKPDTYIQKRHLDSFFEASGHSFTTDKGRESFAQRIIISTSERWSKNAEEMLEHQLIPTNRIGTAAIAESPINWDVTFPGSEIEINLTRREVFSSRPHQQEAISKAIAGFEAHDRGKLIMACGTGKTFTALRLVEQYAENNGGRARVLFLVPSISLLSQTLKEWTAQNQEHLPLKSYAVCSDTKVSKKAEDIASYDLEVPVSTNGKDIAERTAQGKRRAGINVIFSTYQSIEAIHEAQAEYGMDDFDLVICDEAHRTTGVTLAGEDASTFVKIHDEKYIKASKRLYMTATPRLFDDNVKGKAEEHSAELASMDDEAIYGPEFYRLGFGEAVDKGLLTDYKVLVMTVEEDIAADVLAANPTNEINLTTASAMIGAWNGLAKRSGAEQDTKSGFEANAQPMRRTVAFAKDIKASKTIQETFPTLIRQYQEQLKDHAATNDVSLLNIDLQVAVEHVDGTMNALERGNKISWLESSIPEDETRILTNARCLSEGVDVPALDSVIFFHPRNSMVDVVQSVGRVMRKAEGKDYGYIILPVAIPPGVSPSQALNDNTRFRVVWQILNALRAHDDRFNAKVNSIALNEKVELPIDIESVKKTKKDEEQSLADKAKEAQAKLDASDTTSASHSESSGEQDLTSAQIALFSLEAWQEAMYVKLVDKVGTRTYWEDWADDVATIAEAQIARIKALINAADDTIRKEFEVFIEGLRGNLNDSITEDEAISMLSQHLITAPVFNALFTEHDFAAHNPVARVMQRMVDALSDAKLESETESLTKFYESVRIRASEVSSASGKQQVIKDLYERFFRKAFKKQSEALGIVYTPVEIVDFILRSADHISRWHFGKGLTDEGVHILDPFTGTGTFMVRLLQSGLIEPDALARKYAGELHATEIMLLAYYVAAVNIETTYNALQAERAQRNGEPEPEYVPFDGIALADTFQIHEEGDILDLKVFKENNAAIQRQIDSPINVIIGNPPYSAKQTSANDDNANLKYPTLDSRIESTFAANSTATNKNSLYDSYLRAFRWSIDRLGTHGVLAFVSNGGWIDSNTADGVRLSLEDELSDIYVYNLRGNQRTAGEQSRKEGGKVFGSGSRNTVAIIIAVKREIADDVTIHYRDIGDYLSTEEKLDIVESSTLENIDWEIIEPNEYGDWLNQRDVDFETWPVLGSKGDHNKIEVFREFSSGLQSNRDTWVYDFGFDKLRSKISRLKGVYAAALSKKGEHSTLQSLISAFPEFNDPSAIKWSSSLEARFNRGHALSNDGFIAEALYRPFCKQHVYFDTSLIHRRYQLSKLFPSIKQDNVLITVAGPYPNVAGHVFATEIIPDLNVFTASQNFPRWTWEHIKAPEGELDFGMGASEGSEPGTEGEILDGYQRVDNITDEILGIYREALGSDVTKDDIFYFVYGQLHDPGYREKYAADLKKMLPHIETPTSRARFDQLAAAGRELMDLHVNYEDVEPWPVTVDVKASADESDRGTWRVQKMKWAKKKDSETGKNVNDVTTLVYNKSVTVRDIPAEADEYMLGSRSALAWIIDRYQVKKDKASGIVNDPNDWADEVGDPRYIVDLIAKVTRVAVETVQIVEGIREVDEDK
ncbi:DEAD/DEAH box helicase [Corynebacterium minutissimum]|uniref:DEAD/DEAH box helicase n=1 Tax=Corynebacterium minutissimum TaxID=38301 RepID=A0A2X4R8X1_9CORY|nr:DEAD/DEAH box helicase [Corynebacterium minutissimum]KHO29219.1 damage-inducible protein [Corynebacterium minutissimum]QPS59077.1 DEAD/DEAH box helicase [Corynebacterium minutissimum]QQA80133.1 DEAD/DEAH box helicase [Corynebacterium minutissimum]SQH99757.1 superfamily II DNA/RNA helicase [Corynebacterium minutissimum]VEG06176.1 superfamily II DNA/RNA helicase [Corynebacterium minutissimum]